MSVSFGTGGLLAAFGLGLCLGLGALGAYVYATRVERAMLEQELVGVRAERTRYQQLAEGAAARATAAEREAQTAREDAVRHLALVRAPVAPEVRARRVAEALRVPAADVVPTLEPRPRNRSGGAGGGGGGGSANAGTSTTGADAGSGGAGGDGRAHPAARAGFWVTTDVLVELEAAKTASAAWAQERRALTTALEERTQEALAAAGAQRAAENEAACLRTVVLPLPDPNAAGGAGGGGGGLWAFWKDPVVWGVAGFAAGVLTAAVLIR